MAGLSFEHGSGDRRRRQPGVQEAAQQGVRLVHRRLHRLHHHPRRSSSRWACRETGSASSSCSRPSALYAGIGIMSRTTDAAEYYVAGRRVPAIYNGMATGADWMSAASFIGMAGTLYLTGYGGLAFIMGWTGGYCLVALLLAPYLRKFGQFTIPDFLGARYEGNLPRFIGIIAAILCSFTYVVAQIYGVGPDHHAAVGAGLRGRHLRRPGRHPGVLVPRRHARRHVDAGGAVHHPDHCLPGSGGLAVGEADRRAGAAGDVRLPAGEGHQARR